MKIHTQELTLRTSAHAQMLDITLQVASVLEASGVTEGLLVVHVPHTTAGVTINENADPDVVHDVLAALEVAVPWRQEFYRHNEDNSAAHVKSSLVGCDQTIPVTGGRMALGTWQGVYFCEFDGPRNRRAIVRIMGQ